MGDRHAHITQACDKMGRLPGCQMIRCSSSIQTQPVGPITQEPYLNAAAMIQTSLSPKTLLKHLNTIEHEHGRSSLDTRVKWGSRPLDLDIIFFGQIICNETGLMIPHPLMHQRWFVLKPLHEIAPDWIHPTLGLTVSQMLANVNP